MRPLPGRSGSPQYRQEYRQRGIYLTLREKEWLQRLSWEGVRKMKLFFRDLAVYIKLMLIITASSAIIIINSNPSLAQGLVQPLNTWPKDLVNSNYNQADPAIAYNEYCDEYFIVWEDNQEDPSEIPGNSYILGTRVRLDGLPSGQIVHIAGAGNFNETDPDIAYNPDKKEYFVVWVQQDGDKPYLSHIMAMRYNLKGEPASDMYFPEKLNTNESKRLTHPKIAYNRWTNTYLVVWEERDASYANPFVTGVFVSEDAENVYPLDEHMIFPKNSFEPDVVCGGARYLVVCTHRNPEERGEYNIKGRFIEYNGEMYEQDFYIEKWEMAQRHPSVAYNFSENEFLTVWEDHHWGWGNSRDIYGRIIKNKKGNAGVVSEKRIGINNKERDRRYRPDVVYKYLNNNKYQNEYLLFYEYRYKNGFDPFTFSSNRGVESRWISADGKDLGVHNSSTITSSWDQYAPVVANSDVIVYSGKKEQSALMVASRKKVSKNINSGIVLWTQVIDCPKVISICEPCGNENECCSGCPLTIEGF